MWLIFKCQNCGERFVEEVGKDEYDPKHIGKYTHIISTHKCKKRTYGCGVLIGCGDTKEDATDTGKYTI
jgi:hypothetical protein